MTKATVAHARDWLLLVRVPFAKDEDEKQSLALCTLMARSLVLNYPREDLCLDSQIAVSKAVKWWNEPDIRKALDAWRATNTPGAPPLPAQAANAPLSEQGKRLYARFLTAQDDPEAARALGIIQWFDRGTFDWILRNDMAAASCAVRRGWKPTMTQNEIAASFDDPDAIAATIRKILAPMPDGRPWAQATGILAKYRNIVARVAPQHLHLFPDTTLAQPPAPVLVAFPPEVMPLWEIS